MEVAGRVDRGAEKSSTDLDVFCTPCEIDGGQETPEGYCEVCKEYLCSTCIIYHRKFRMTKQHIILQGDDIPSKSTQEKSVIDTDLQVCSEHPEEFLKYFCQNHAQCGCSTCIVENHRHCTVGHILTLSKGYTSSKEYKTLISNCEQMSADINGFKRQIPEIHKEADTIMETAVCDIEHIRRDINRYLDTGETKLREEVTEIHKTTRNTLHSAIELCDTLQDRIPALKENKNNEYKSFVMAKYCLKEVGNTQAPFDKLMQRQDIRPYGIKFLSSLQEIIDSPENFGTVAFHNICGHMKFGSKIDEVQPAGSNFHIPRITGMAIVSLDKLIVTDYYNRKVQIINTSNQRIISSLNTTTQPWDVTLIAPDKAAVTIPAERKITVISTKGLHLVLKRSFCVNGECRGICYNDRKLFVTYVNPGKLEILNLDGSLSCTVDVNKCGLAMFKRPLHATVFNKSKYICVSDKGTNMVTILTMTGAIVRRFKVNQIEYRGVVSLDDCFVGFCSVTTNELCIMSFRGENHKLVDRIKCVENPLCVAFCKDNGTFYVSSGNTEQGNYIHTYKLLK